MSSYKPWNEKTQAAFLKRERDLTSEIGRVKGFIAQNWPDVIVENDGAFADTVIAVFKKLAPDAQDHKPKFICDVPGEENE